MKKKMQSILSLALAVLMLMSVVPLSANAATYSGDCGAQGDNVTWEIDVNTATLFINGTGDMADYSSFEAAPWYAYGSYPGFIYIAVGEGVASVGDHAFGNRNVIKITLSSTVKDLGVGSFFNNANIVIDEENSYLVMDDYGVIYSADGKTLVYASKGVFSDTEIYVVPDGVEEFAPYAFYHFSSASMFVTVPRFDIPVSVKNIPADAFFTTDWSGAHPTATPRFIVDKDNPYYSNDEYGVLFDKNKEILYMAPFRFIFFGGTNYFIPETVKEIADYAFYGVWQEHIFITENVTKIGSCALAPYCDGGDLTYLLYVPKTVTNLADDFFVNEKSFASYSGVHALVYYEGTQEEWESVYKGNKDWLTVYYEHEHTNTNIRETCTQKIYTCSVCETVNKIEDIGDNHDWELKGYINGAPCIGFTKGYYCTKCWEEKEEHETPTEEHHFYGDEYDYLCCVGGNANLRCKYCEMDYDVYVEAEGHLYEYVSDNNATCTEDGTKHEVCSRCEATGETVVDVGSKLGHDLTETTVLSQTTCTQDGISVQICKRCLGVESATESAYGHYDNDADGKCDECKVVLEVNFPDAPVTPDEETTETPEVPEEETTEAPVIPDEPEIPEDTETPEEPQESTNFFAKIMEFFNKIINMIKSLFGM